ncbi:uncharacterized protein LOC128267070 [Anopheles cruzii]|uniref:uncharacterized protein LOC128267070 n=1 Tax=Anopheles cruzii TaxID=68878 RepID=UPI0022EC7033|nr:uncharacterized protein LOC128267070 [Anopheles cruzii]
MAEEDEGDEEEDEEGEEDDDKPVSINSDSDGGSDVEEPAETDHQQHRSTAKPKLADEGEKQKKKKTEGGDRLPMLEDTVRVATPEVVQKSLHSGGSKPSNGGFPVAISNQNGDGSGGDCDGDVTFLSDKEDDCVVIEDDEVDGEMPPATGSASMTEAGTVRSRSSASRSRRSLPPGIMLHAAGGAAPPSLVSTDDEDDDDDDIQEIIDDPLAPDTTGGAMRGSLLAAVGGSGQLGSFPVAYKGSSQKSLLMNSSGGASTGSGTGKDPPTLVIIDTNTLMNNQRSANVLGAPGSPATGMGNNASLLAKAAAIAAGGSPMGGGGGYGMAGNALAVAAAAAAAAGGQFVGNSRSLLNSVSPSATSAGVLMAGGNYAKVVAPPLTPVTPLLPALTDDMFVLEAPSFIVPYIYEKPPVDNLRDIVDDLEVHIKEMRKKLDESGGGSVDPLATAAADAAEGADKKDAASNQQSAAADASATAEARSAPDATQKEPGRDTGRKRKRPTDDDDEWDELDTSTDDEASDEEHKTKVLIKEVKADMEHIILPSSEKDVLGGGGGGGVTGSGSTAGGGDAKKSENYFENPLGKFFMNIGINLVQEFVQTDLLRQQKRKRDREGKPSPSTQLAINSLMKNLEQSKENNKPYKFEVKRCEYCPFRSESSLVMAHHYETPHMRNFVYKCNFCAYETRPPHDILFHMEAVHNIKGRMEKALSYHHCPNCLFEDNGKSKLARHAVACAKKFRPEINLNPPVDWEPPAKIPRIKPKHGLVGTATAYQAMTAQQQKNLALANQQRINQQQQSVQLTQQHLAAHQALQQQQQQHHAQSLAAAQQHLGMVSVNAANVNNLANLSPAAQAAALRARAVGTGGGGSLGGVGRAPSIIPSPTGITAAAAASLRTAGGGGAGVNVAAAASAAIRNTLAGAGMVIPNNLQLSASALAAAAVAGGFSKYAPNSLNAGRSLLANTNSSITIQNVSNMKTTKTAQPPSISITPLPRQSSSNSANMANIAGALSKLQSQGTSAVKPGQIPGGGKTAFVVCEICDGYIKDLDQLRNHMQWIHKVKIHPKMIYNRPPLNCQKCQYRFFTDQGLERHLLGSHGLVTSSMQEAANKGKDAGRCPVCGRVYQWKLLNHVSRDHSMTLKPAHLSYKCTVCTATFGMYKQFESHVYSAHSTVAKKTVDSKGKGGGNVQQSAMNLIGNSAASSAGSGTSSSGMRGGGGDSLLKPLKINDEITIIPQPTSNSSKMMKTIELESHVID